MDDKTLFLLELFKRDGQRDLQLLHDHFERISNLLIKINAKLSEVKTGVKEYEEYFEVHYFKFILQGLSIQHLFNGTPFRYIKADAIYHDISSLYSLSRSLLESFLTINYLYFNFKSDEQAMFRYLLYSASGLNQRQSYPANIPEHSLKKEKEKKDIDAMLIRINSNSYFLSLHVKKRNHILGKLLSYEIGKEEMIAETGLNTETFHTLWRLFSNYSHAEVIEAMQVQLYVQNKNVANENLYSTFRFCLMLHCHLLSKIAERFELARRIYEASDSKTKYAAEFWKSILTGIT